MARRSRRRSSRWAPPSSTSWYPPPSRPRPADGIRARSRRGDIGETWWSKRFIEILESFDIGTRLTRGRRYARAGQVLVLDVSPGEVISRVQGSRAAPYGVRIGVLPLPEKDWARAEEAMASRALFLAKLLAGEMPRDIEEAFNACRLSLFPTSPRDLTTDCTCPDWANPCKHIAATYYLLAEAFDADPFLIFRWRGRDRDALLRQLRARRGGEAVDLAVDAGGSAAGSGVAGGAGEIEALWAGPAAETTPLPTATVEFWAAGDALEQVVAHPRAAEVPEALLRQLESPGLQVRGVRLEELLAQVYGSIAKAAERRALGAPKASPP